METKKTNAKQNNKGHNSKQQDPTQNNKENNKATKEPKTNATNDTSGLRKNSEAAIKKLSIYEKLFNAQQTIGAVLKTGENTHHKYKYAKELDIIAEAKPVFKEQRLTYTHTTKACIADGKSRRLTITFNLINVDKPTEVIPYDVEAEGENKEGSVVGIPVAYTMALKYFLAKALMLETGNDAEIDTLNKKKKEAGKEGKTDKNPDEEYQRSLNLIKSTRNIDGLHEYATKVKEGKFFNQTQKDVLLQAIEARLTELQQ